MSGVVQLKFCVWCGEKRVKEVKKELDQLFNTRELQLDSCGLCHRLLTERKTLRITSPTQSPVKTSRAPHSSHVGHQEHNILQQSGISLSSEENQSVIPVLLNVIKQLGSNVVQITQQRGESGELESLVTLADVKNENVAENQPKQEGESSSKLPTPVSGSAGIDDPEIHSRIKSAGNFNQDVESDDDFADPLPDGNNFPEDTVIMESVSESSTLQEARDRLDTISTSVSRSASTTEVTQAEQPGLNETRSNLPNIPNTDPSPFKVEDDDGLEVDMDGTSLRKVLDPKVFNIIHSKSDFTKYIVCKFCSFQRVPTGLGVRNLIKHVASMHPEEPKINKPYRCPKCGLKAELRSRLAVHMITCGVREKPFKCPICGRGYSFLASLGLHIRKGKHSRPVKVKPPVAKRKRGRPPKAAGKNTEEYDKSEATPRKKMKKAHKRKNRKSDVGKKSQKDIHIASQPSGDIATMACCTGSTVTDPEKVDSSSVTDLHDDVTEMQAEEVVTGAGTVQDMDSEHNRKLKQTPHLVLQRVSVSRHQMNRLGNSASSIENEMSTKSGADTAGESKKPSRGTEGKSASMKSLRDTEPGLSSSNKLLRDARGQSLSKKPSRNADEGIRTSGDVSEAGKTGNMSVEDVAELPQSVQTSSGTEDNARMEDASNLDDSKLTGSRNLEEDTNPEKSENDASLERSDRDDLLIFPSVDDEMDMENPLTILHPQILDMIDREASTTEQIVCKLCKEKFIHFKCGASVIRFSKHISTHKNQSRVHQVYACRKCDFKSKAKASFQAHVEKSHRKDNAYSCNYCDRTFAFKNSVQKHQRQHLVTSEPTSVSNVKEGFDIANLANILDKELQDMLDMDYDINSTLVCKLCGTSNKPTLIGVRHFAKHVSMHKETAVIRSLYKCPECMERFTFPATLESHWESKHAKHNVKHQVHDQNIRYKCLQCDDHFSSGEKLKEHVENEHSDKETEGNDQISHEDDDTNRGIDQLEQEVINKVNSPDDIDSNKSHIKRNEPEKVFNDDLSVLLVPTLRDMVHKDCNLKESVICKVCNTTFQTTERAIRQFAKHIVEHTGEPVISILYQCSDCPQQFRTLFTLKSHWTSVHQQKEEEERMVSDESDGEVSDAGQMSEESEESESEERSSDDEAVVENGDDVTPEKDRVKFTKGTHSNTDANSSDSASNGKSGESNEVSADTNEESPSRTSSKSSGKADFKNDKFVNSLDPEVLEAVHEDCDLKECITCKYCQQPFSITSRGIRYFVKHIVVHTGKPVIDKPFKCSDCNANFKASFEVHQHKIYHHGVKGNYKCQECGKMYNKRNNLYQHMSTRHRKKNSHRKKNIVMCEQCGQNIPETRLRTHMSHHTGVFDIHCQVWGCKFKTSEKRYLEQHMEHVHKPKSDICRFCGLSFPLKGALGKHERKHLNNEPIIHKKYRCDECGFSTDIIYELSLHKRRHNKEFRFQCRHCDKKFQQRSSCMRHIPYCQKQLGLPVDDVKSAIPVDLFVRKRKWKQDQKVETVVFPVTIEKIPIQEGQPINVQHFAEDSIPYTVASTETVPVTSTGVVDEPAVEIATAIANLQFMQS